jgi:acetyl esterase/lipase
MMAEIGPRWRSDISGHIRAMLEGFSMVLKDAPKEGVEVRRGIRYGDDPRQEYGLFLPAGPECNRPAVLFVHGGAFTEGSGGSKSAASWSRLGRGVVNAKGAAGTCQRF